MAVHDRGKHRPVSFGVKPGTGIGMREFLSERLAWIPANTEQHIGLADQLTIDFSCTFCPTERMPQGRTVVEVIRDDRAVASCRGHRLACNRRGALRKTREHTAAVKPARTFSTEDPLPVDIARLELGDRRVTAIRATERRSDSVTTLNEVQAITNTAPNPVIWQPVELCLPHTTLADQVLNEAAERVVSERGHDPRAHPETVRKTTHDVVLAAPLPNLKAPGCRDP